MNSTTNHEFYRALGRLHGSWCKQPWISVGYNTLYHEHVQRACIWNSQDHYTKMSCRMPYPQALSIFNNCKVAMVKVRYEGREEIVAYERSFHTSNIKQLWAHHFNIRKRSTLILSSVSDVLIHQVSIGDSRKISIDDWMDYTRTDGSVTICPPPTTR